MINRTILGATNNDGINNRSILNGGVRARMRLHSSENLTPSACRGFTNVHLSPNYGSGNSQTISNKNVGSSNATSTDGMSSNLGSSSSSGSLSASTLANGHAIPMADKSTVSPGSRRRTYITNVRPLTDICRALKDQPTSTNVPESRVYTRSSYGNAEQSSMLKSEPRGMSRSEQSAMISGICTGIRGIALQDQSAPPNADDSQASDSNVSPHAPEARGALRIEQPVVATLSDGRVMTRPEQSTSVILGDDLRCVRQLDQPDRNSRATEDLRAMRQQSTEQSTNSRATEDLRAMRQQPEQSTSVRITEDACAIRQQPEQSTSARVTEDVRAIRQQAEQSANIRTGEDSRAVRQQQPKRSVRYITLADLQIRPEQSMNAPVTDQRAVPRGGQQNTDSPLTDARAISSQQLSMIPATDGRTIAEHMSSTASPDLRPVPRIPQNTNSLPSQTNVVPVTGQSSVAQPGSSILIAEDVAHSEEPLPTGWEMRYDVYGRR